MKHNFQIHPNQIDFFSTENVQLAYDIVVPPSPEEKTQILLLINGFQRTRQDFRVFRQKIAREAGNTISIAFDNRFCGQTKVISSVSSRGSTAGSTKSLDPAVEPRDDIAEPRDDIAEPRDDIAEPRDDTLVDFAQDTLALLRHCMNMLSIERVHVLGISMGGMIAQILASLPDCPEIQTLFLVSTTAGGENRVWPAESHLCKTAPIDATRPPHSEERMALYFGDKFLTNSPLLFKMFVQNMQKTIKSDDDKKAFCKQAQSSQNFEGVNDLKDLKAKNVVIISGDADKVMPLQNSKTLAERIPNSSLLVYPQVGHLILIENPNEFVHDVANFLNKKDSSH